MEENSGELVFLLVFVYLFVSFSKSRTKQSLRNWISDLSFLYFLVEYVRNLLGFHNHQYYWMLIFAILSQVRMQLGMAWPEYTDQSVGSTWYLKWQSEAEMSFKSRKTDDIQWFFWFFIRSMIYGYVLLNVIRFVRRKVPRLLGYGPLRRDPNLRKLRRVVIWFRICIFYFLILF